MGSTSAQTAAALESRRRRTKERLEAVATAIGRLERDRRPVQVAVVARLAHTSRAFLYQNPEARALLADALSRPASQTTGAATVEAGEAAAWRERALNSEEALTQAMREIAVQRQTLADLLGQVREFDNGHTEEQVQRLLTFNTDLRRQVRDLSEANRTLTERLDAARSHARFLDKRVADLEAEVIEAHRP